MRYTDTVAYEANEIGAEARRMRFAPLWVPVPFPRSPLWTRLATLFDPEHFTHGCPPVDVGPVALDTSSMDGIRVLRCPIKACGSDEVVLPEELAPLAPLVRHVLELEAHANPLFASSWIHLSFERTRVEAGATQRVPGWHVDGFQGVRAPRHLVEHSYLWADRDPTEYCVQPFFLSHLDPGRHNVFAEMERQAREGNAMAGLPGHAYLIDPYLVHRSPVSAEPGFRSFVRITCAETELEDPANTRNLSLGPSQDYAPRLEARDRLHPYRGEVPWEWYGVRPLAAPVEDGRAV